MSIEKIKLICDKHQIDYSKDDEGQRGFQIKIPKGRAFSMLNISNAMASKILNEAPDFYNYKFVDGYEALWSPKNKTLECEIKTSIESRSLHRMLSTNYDEEDLGPFIIPPYKEGLSIEISTGSNVFTLLKFAREQLPKPIRYFEILKDTVITIKISGLDITRHEQALDIVEKICSAICFQINYKAELPVMLSYESKGKGPRKRRKTLQDFEATPVQYTYDKEALSLYWYAESASRMPMLNFLALYQVVEFYYPVYSKIAAQKKIRNVLKDPKFNANNDKDLAKVMNIVKYNSSSGAFGNELAQLKATISECVDMEELKAWLKSEKNRDDYFRSSNAKSLSEYIVNSTIDNDALLDQVAQRLYNIRCRIVHTKGLDGNLDVLHPQAKELAYIDYDIALAKFIAHMVIIASSHPII